MHLFLFLPLHLAPPMPMKYKYILPETNITPENRPGDRLPNIHFQVQKCCCFFLTVNIIYIYAYIYISKTQNGAPYLYLFLDQNESRSGQPKKIVDCWVLGACMFCFWYMYLIYTLGVLSLNQMLTIQ